LNYCPLVFIEESGRNRTPDKLPKHEREPLFDSCDKALKQTIELFKPKHVIGVGAFAEKRAIKVLEGMDVRIGRITHPSPANPKANRGWEECIAVEFSNMGITI
ncbi:MAG: single-stranded DNA-binding protein, partial [Proteobacteria bacterium]|nr:single-stranded DNA-binding protein [Pseudomonadota bacterium]